MLCPGSILFFHFLDRSPVRHALQQGRQVSLRVVKLSVLAVTIFSHGDFFTIVDLPEGDHEYKFSVDGNWQHNPTEVCIFIPTPSPVFWENLYVCFSESSSQVTDTCLQMMGSNSN